MACMERQSHQLVLAENSHVGNVAVCGCGTIHVSLGAVSLRLSPEVFGEAVAMMRMAMQNLLRHGAEAEMANEIVH
ncbi:MAG: hypothetical protein INR71_07535 [Terriglobus roseus]|nr:hypothetical protein [Terriglobus roseus]